MLVGPVDRHSWGDAEVRERRLGIKRAFLEKAEAAAAKREKDGGRNDEFVQVRSRNQTLYVVLAGVDAMPKILEQLQ